MTAATIEQAPPAQPGGEHATRAAVGTWTTTRVELAKLAAQKRARLAVVGCVLAPFLLTVVLDGQQRPPKDTLYGRHIHDSGFAVALFVLTFASQWVLPFLTALVAGDIFASEDHLGTWKTVLTRSASRAQLFRGKCLAAVLYTLAALAVLAASTITAGLVLVGHQTLVGLSGQPIPDGTAWALVAAAWATVAPPMLAFTGIAILLSVLTRNPAVGVVAPILIGLVTQLVGWLGGMDTARRLLPTTPFDAWHGLFTEQRATGLLVQGAFVSFGWFALTIGAALLLLRRRDITGG